MPADLKWGAEFLVTTTRNRTQSDPDIAALADGRFIVTWSDDSRSGNDGSDYAVRAQLFNGDGTTYGGEFLVNTETTRSQSIPAVAVLADGRFVVAWQDASRWGADTSSTGVKAQLFNVDGTKSGGEFLVNTTTAGNQAVPQIAALNDGRFVVSWSDDSQSGGDTSQWAVRAQVFNANGSKSGGEFLVNATTANTQYGGKIAALANGRFVICWGDTSESGGDTSHWAVRAQVFNADGTKFGGEFLVNTTTDSHQFQPAITALANGRFVVCWTDGSGSAGDSSAYAVRAQVFNANGTKSGGEFLVNTTTLSDQMDPAIAALPDGRFVICWWHSNRSNDGTSRWDVRAQLFSADGTKSGSEFPVNTTIAGNQIEPAVTALKDGRIVVSWRGEGSSGNVFAQIFDPRTAAIEVEGGAGSENINGTLFDDRLWGNGGDDVLRGAAGNDRLAGRDGHDLVDGGEGDDTLTGGAGADLIDGGSGADSMDGGKGDDIYIVDSAGDVILADRKGIDTVQASVSWTLASGLENLTLTGKAAIGGTGNGLANTIQGNGGANVLMGLDGDDWLSGGAGDDTLDGGLGSDLLQGGDGNDSVRGREGNDVLSGGAGNDEVLGAEGNDAIDGGSGNDVIAGGDGNDLLDGGDGVDTARYISAASGVTVDLAVSGQQNTGAAGLDTLANVENVMGSEFADQLSGNAGSNVLVGSDGDDVLSGRDGDDLLDGEAGADTMDGGSGNDTYVVDTAGDLILPDAGGIDTVKASASYTLVSSLENLTLTGSAAIDGTGNGADNIIIGNAAANTLSGKGGTNVVTGAGGDDTFLFDTVLVAGAITTIADFSAGADTIALSRAIFTKVGPVGPMAAGAFFIGAAAHDASDRLIYNSTTGALSYDSDGTGAQAAKHFATLGRGLAFSANDFEVV